MFNLEEKWPNKVEQTGSTLGLSEIRRRHPTCAYHTQAGSQFISSHSFPVPAAGLIPSPPSAPAHCGRYINLRQIQNIH